jgi:uncharacterized membrane protein
VNRYLADYAAAVGVMIALDLLWLGVLAKATYKRAIGHLMADEPNLIAAAAFYALFAFGVVALIVVPNATANGMGKTLVSAALLGLIAYGTYDLTNLATLKNWPTGFSMLDMAWGTFVTASSGVAAKLAFDRFAG